jgi:hypothetical protein
MCPHLEATRRDARNGNGSTTRVCGTARFDCSSDRAFIDHSWSTILIVHLDGDRIGTRGAIPIDCPHAERTIRRDWVDRTRSESRRNFCPGINDIIGIGATESRCFLGRYRRYFPPALKPCCGSLRESKSITTDLCLLSRHKPPHWGHLQRSGCYLPHQ